MRSNRMMSSTQAMSTIAPYYAHVNRQLTCKWADLGWRKLRRGSASSAMVVNQDVGVVNTRALLAEPLLAASLF